LNLSHCHLDLEGFESLLPVLPTLPSLTTLHLASNHLLDGSLSYLLSSDYLTSRSCPLTTLSLACNLFEDPSNLEYLADLLDFDEKRYQKHDLQCRSLKRLDLSGNEWGKAEKARVKRV